MSHKRTPMGAADERASNGLIIGIGVGIITAVTGLSIAGTYTAINAMNRQSEEVLAGLKATVDNKGGDNPTEPGGTPPASSDTASPSPSQEPSASPAPSGTEYATKQIEWMQKNGIYYDEYGLPRDSKGQLVDDPTTAVDDKSRIAYFFNDDGTPKNPSVEDLPRTPSDQYIEDGPRPVVTPEIQNPEPGSTETPGGQAPVVNPDVDSPDVEKSGWWFDKDGNLLPGLSLDSSGKPYYVVQPGDSLGGIGIRYGFRYQDLARESGIVNPNVIYPGDIVRFPEEGPSFTPGTYPAGPAGTTAPGVITGGRAPGRG